MKPLTQLRKTFPNANIAVLGSKINTYGCNLYFQDKCVTVYFTKQRYGIGERWGYYSTMSDLISIVNQLINPEPKVAHIEAQVPKTDNKVQSCIDHILKKREFIMQNQPDNRLAAFCLSLSKELEQYL